MNVIWQLCRRHWAAFLLLGFWFMMPWLAAAVTADLPFALRFSWMGAVPFAIYMYRASSGSQLLGILPLARREVWQITCVIGALAPALLQLVVALIVWLMATVLLPSSAGIQRVGIETPLLGAVYTVAFLQLVLIATASFQRQRAVSAALALPALGAFAWFADVLPARVSEFSPASALGFWAAAIVAVVIVRSPGTLAAPIPARSQSYRLAFNFPGFSILDRLTGVKRILLVHTLFGVVCFGAAMAFVLMTAVWLDRGTLTEVVADELRAFSGENIWVLRPGDSLFFTPMWIIGFANIWTPMAHQLRVLPLTPSRANALFLASPFAMWVVLWTMYLVAYAAIVGGPITPRLDLFLAISSTSTLANVISLRWKNRLYGMFGFACVYGFWMLASVVGVMLNLTDILIPLTVIGLVFYGAAIAINHHTLVHATSASAAYQRQPKFFDTPTRG
jgi:hypothetical protein